MQCEEILLKRAGPQDESIVQAIYEHSPDYFRRVDGSEVLSHFARKDMADVPKVQSPTYEKVFLIAYDQNKPIGVVDLHKDHPSLGKTYLGLLLLDENYHGRGVGRRVYQAAEKFAREKLQASLLKLGVSEQNDVTGYWEKMGFAKNGKTYLWKGETIETLVHEMEKQI